MNRRHAAALVLLGWYLMSPPFGQNGGGLVKDAPLKAWQNLAVYDSADDCTEDGLILHRIHKGTPTRLFSFTVPKGLSNEEEGALTNLAVHSTICIASDDPRLAK